MKKQILILAKKIAAELENEIEYKLRIEEFYRIRDNEYNKLVLGGNIVDTDDNYDDFNTYLARYVNNNNGIDWG